MVTSKRNLSDVCTKNRLSSSARRRGQAMVETGLVVVILLLLSIGLFQYGMIYSSSLALNNLAREGARYAAVRSLSTTDNAALKNMLIDHLKARAAGTTINQSGINSSSVAVERTTNAAGKEIRVRINYDLKKKSFAPALLPLPARYANYQATASNLIEN